MARRAHSSIHPLWICAIVGLLLVLIGGGYFLFGRTRDPFRTVAVFETAAYLENSNSLRGNVYKFEGTVQNSLGWSASVGRLFSVEINSGSNIEVLPILVPTQFNHVNLQKGQRFFFKIEVDGRGILKIQDLKKA